MVTMFKQTKGVIMIMRKETLVFLTSLAIIFIIGYINMTLVPENPFDFKNVSELEDANKPIDLDDDLDEILNGSNKTSDNDLVKILDQTDKSDITINPSAKTDKKTIDDILNASEEIQNAHNETDYVILGDITNILKDDSVTASSEGILNSLNINFANFKLNRDKKNMDVIDHLEDSLSNDNISVETKNQFEALLLDKNDYMQTENNIEIMLQAKGYNETIVIVDSDMIKVVSNDTIEQADATKIKDIIVSETNYEPAQIKIVKFDNIDL